MDPDQREARRVVGCGGDIRGQQRHLRPISDVNSGQETVPVFKVLSVVSWLFKTLEFGSHSLCWLQPTPVGEFIWDGHWIRLKQIPGRPFTDVRVSQRYFIPFPKRLFSTLLKCKCSFKSLQSASSALKKLINAVWSGLKHIKAVLRCVQTHTHLLINTQLLEKENFGANVCVETAHEACCCVQCASAMTGGTSAVSAHPAGSEGSCKVIRLWPNQPFDNVLSCTFSVTVRCVLVFCSHGDGGY